MIPETLQVQVRRIEWKCDGVLEFVLVDGEGAALPSFSAGAHIDVQVPGIGLRQYSLVNEDTERGKYVIAVRCEQKGRGGSRAMHERVRAGDTLTISAPRNMFALDPGTDRYWLVAGGIGITPLVSMARTLYRQRKPFRLFYCTRSASVTPYCEEIRESPWRESVTFIHDDGDPRAGLDVRSLLSDWTPGTQLYCCGPAPLLDAVLTHGARLPQGAVRYERFSAAAAAGPEFTVRLRSSGRVIVVPPAKSILECLRGAGVDIESSCEQGICGTCRVGVISGVPEHHCHLLSPQERDANDQMLVCVSRACAGEELVLDL
ncbi:Phthalate dioxygenase reductase [Variovorax sp. SRS16]|uniref:PDR/VanB family oxidoreductase n=1 Tax=Variovorax sp. SRS16 TaxID=282217 RepID=UPI0013183032|nr:PDR/VanB family oxidoreductase [Variovorax sp. SRS16]VTU14994.1 Phthalate dioxygenase reductase [Variovorax sp. SRS16]